MSGVPSDNAYLTRKLDKLERDARTTSPEGEAP
jgi:hypothetical protein